MRARDPYIVAELSANHFGHLPRALSLIDAAAEAGASAVKIQCWSALSVDRRPLDTGPWAGWSLRDLYERCRTPWGWWPALADRAHERNVELFSSVFDPESLAHLERMGCPRYKIASFEVTDLPLIREVAQTGKPMIISTGMAKFTEIEDARSAALAGGCSDLTFLRCTSSYPAPVSESHLATMIDMKHRFGCPTGLSDHTLGISAAVAATALGATMIEKHLTLDRKEGGPDAGFSAEPAEFKAMVAACREAAASLGEVRYGPADAEAQSLNFRRSLWVTEDLKAGDMLTPENLRSLRPGDGIAAKHWPEVLGRKIARAVSRETPLAWEMLDGVR